MIDHWNDLISTQLELFRSFLPPGNNLCVNSNGNFIEISLKLFDDVYFNFVFDSRKLSKRPLTIGNVIDLHLNRSTDSISLNQQQWINIQQFFYQLIAHSKSANTIYLIIRLIQERLSEINRKNLKLVNRKLFNNNDRFDFMLPLKSNRQCFTIEGLYQFDLLTHQWILTSTRELSNVKFLREQCRVITWNIRAISSLTNFVDQNERYSHILQVLRSTSATFICLQEVTHSFADRLFNERWMQDENNSLILSKNIFNSEFGGQMILMKNLCPQAFDIQQLESVDSSMIIVRFLLAQSVSIDLVHLRLNESNSLYSNEQRRRTLNYFFETMFNKNYLLLCDSQVQLDDVDDDDEDFFAQLDQHSVRNLWFDSIQTCKNLSSAMKNQIRSRSHQYYLHTVVNLMYSLDSLSLIDHPLITTDEFCLSHQYPLELKVRFRPRLLNCRSALAIVLPREKWTDQSVPHLKLFSPFFQLENPEDDVENILLPLRRCLARENPFELEMIQIDTSNNLCSTFKPRSTAHLRRLRENLRALFSFDHFNNQQLNQFEMIFTKSNENSKINLCEFFRFSVNYLYFIETNSNDQTESIRIIYQIPLGNVLQPIDVDPSENIAEDLQKFFIDMNFYHHGRRSHENKQDKFDRFTKIFDSIDSNCFTLTLLSYGSFRLGLYGDDLDLILMIYEKTSLNYRRTSFDKILFQLKHDALGLNKYFLDILWKNLENEIVDCYQIVAVYPIISILFNDETSVELSVKYEIETKFPSPIHGVDDIERILIYARSPVIFQHFLTFIRQWAQHIGIYGQVYGYLPGISWALLCAWICRHSKLFQSIYCNLNEFANLVQEFFSVYSNWNFQLDSIYFSSINRRWLGFVDRSPIRIFCPTFPWPNSARLTIESTSRIIFEAFQNGFSLTQTQQSKFDVLRAILCQKNSFPHRNLHSILRLIFSDVNQTELLKTIGWVKSRFIRFIRQCEDDCNLFVQTDCSIQFGSSPLERVYLIGFSDNAERLSQCRPFSRCLHEFFSQLKSNPSPNSRIQISYRFSSIVVEKHNEI